jgi:hypothetical protein
MRFKSEVAEQCTRAYLAKGTSGKSFQIFVAVCLPDSGTKKLPYNFSHCWTVAYRSSYGAGKVGVGFAGRVRMYKYSGTLLPECVAKIAPISILVPYRSRAFGDRIRHEGIKLSAACIKLIGYWIRPGHIQWPMKWLLAVTTGRGWQ